MCKVTDNVNPKGKLQEYLAVTIDVLCFTISQESELLVFLQTLYPLNKLNLQYHVLICRLEIDDFDNKKYALSCAL